MALEALQSRFLEKLWGSHHLSPWFPDSPAKIGEVWLEGPHGAQLPLLIKFLFTTERLSVQVHPNDAYAETHHNSKGKTEMWHILRAEPGAQVALGLNRALTSKQELREASESGAILGLLNWIDARPGDTFFVPAGTIHAIGAGLALCEIQQFSDVTYRLYDYGRPRELHLDDGVEVSNLNAYQPEVKPKDALVICEYFRTELIEAPGPLTLAADPAILIAIQGEGAIDGTPFSQGQAWLTNSAPLHIEPAVPSRFLKTFVP
jgi:mannose-6-phosphate isomerase